MLAQWLASISVGGIGPISPRSRLWLNQSTYSATAISTATDFQPPLGRIMWLRMHSALNREFSASAIALS